VRRFIKKVLIITLILAAHIFLVSSQLSMSQEIELSPLAPSAKPDIHEKVDAIFTSEVVKYGAASWYSESDPHINRHTANGEIFDDTAWTCASWEYPFGTFLEVTNIATWESVVCRVNDRGPAKRLGRRIDLTKSAFRQIGDLRKGLIQVRVISLKK